MSDPEGSAGPPAGPGPSPAARRLDGLALAALLLAVAAAGALLLGPTAGQPLPGPDQLGQPAPATLRADRDYELEDAEATARRRASAVAAVRPVYDLDVSAGDEAAARVRAAFALLRQEAADFRREQPAASPAELDRHLAAVKDDFVSRLQVLASDEDLAALVAARFPEAAERGLAALVTRGLEGPLVGDRALLPADRALGLVVRALRGGEVVGEQQLADLAPIRDLATARADLPRAGITELAGLAPGLRAALVRLASAALRPTLVFNLGETERRRAEAASRVRPAVLLVRRGERVVTAGERLEPLHLAVVEAMRTQAQGEDRGRIRLGGALVLALLAVVVWRFAAGALPRFRPPARDAALLAGLLLLELAVAAAGTRAAALVAEGLPSVPREALLGLLPLAAGALVARLVLSAEAALLLAVATGLAAAALAGPSPALALHAGLTSLAVAGLGGRGGRRIGLLAGGAAAGLAGAVSAAGVALQAGRSLGDVARLSGLALAGGVLLVPALAWPLVVLAERLLGYLTTATLERLANLNHPALKELIVQAPGTYHHSILTGTLAEAAARAVGADPLLAKVGAYYHDLGKSRAPLLFAENQRGRNEHEKLEPAASAALIVNHVADGLALARRYRLPRAVVEIMAQHHGTRRVGYFWAKQQKRQESGEAAPVEEHRFRYPGPKPRRREAALVLLADACEATARVLEGPTPAQLRAAVERRVAEAAAEGQLDECELTMGELAAAARALSEALVGIYRERAPTSQAEVGAPVIQLKARP